MRYLKSYKLFEDLPHVTKRKYEFENTIIPMLESECAPFLKEIVNIAKKKQGFTINDIIWRGYSRKYSGESYVRKKARKDREPFNTNYRIHNIIDDLSFVKFGWKIRSEGVFTIADKHTASTYGVEYIFIPISEYKYLYNNNILDLYSVLSIKSYYNSFIDDSESESDINDISKLLDGYKDNYLEFGINEKVEIQFKCDEYFLLNKEYDDDFIYYINNLAL